MLHPKFFLWVLLGGITLLVLVLIRAIAVWRSVEQPLPTHDLTTMIMGNTTTDMLTASRPRRRRPASALPPLPWQCPHRSPTIMGTITTMTMTTDTATIMGMNTNTTITITVGRRGVTLCCFCRWCCIS